MFGGLFFWILDPLYFGGRNFLNSNMFLTIFDVLDVPIGGVQVLFGHQKQQSPPLGSGLRWTLNWLFMASMQKRE